MVVSAVSKSTLMLFRTVLLGSLLVVGMGAAIAAQSLLAPDVVSKNGRSHFDIKSEAHPVVLNRNALAYLQPQDELEFLLPDATRYIAVFDRIEDHGGGIRSSVGYLKAHGKDFRVIITTGPNGAFGSIRTPAGSYRIVPGLAGQDLLVDMAEEQKLIPYIDLGDDSRRVPDDHFSEAKNGGLPANLLRAADQPGESSIAFVTPAPQVTIDLMIVYTNGLATRLGAGLMTRLFNLVTAANTAYIDSEVAITLRLVNATMVNYTDAPGDGTALDAITPAQGGGAGVFSNIESIRNANGADLVSFLRNGSDFGGSGLAWLTTSATPAPSYMYSVITGCVVGCDSVFIHELGHNMGNAHDRATAAFQDGGVANPSAGAFAYSFGHFFCASGLLTCDPSLPAGSGGCNTQPVCTTSNVNNVGTIMSYFNPVTLKFSNPNVLCSQPNGASQPCGVANQEDNARSMNNMRVALAAVKATQIAVPTGALQFSATSFNATESSSLATISVSRVGGSGGNVSVSYATQDGTAKAGFDYVATSGTLNWADGDTANKTFTVTLINDGVTEGGESFAVNLSNPTGATGIFLGVPTTASVQINESSAWPPGGTFPAGFTAPPSNSGVWAVENVAANCASGQAPCVGSPQVLATVMDFSTYQFSDLQYSSAFPAGNVNFSYRVSSLGTSFANLQFLIDGVVAFASAGGETGWLTASIPITAGNHTITWRFRNRVFFACANASSPTPPPNCQDRAWIDDVSLPVTVVSSNTAVVSSSNPSSFGQSVTFTATVTGGAGTPIGAMTFRDAGTIITNCNLVTLTSGSAQCTTNALGAGSHAITAAYSGNTTYDVSTSSTLGQTVNAAQATVPGAPTVGAATAGNAQAMITFTTPASDGGSAITGYTATCNPGALTGTSTNSPVAVSGLTNGLPYTCAVTANNAVGASASSGTVMVTPSASAPLTLVSVLSSKTHAGIQYGIAIDTSVATISGAVTVEPRFIGAGHTIWFQFNNAINATGTLAVVDGSNATVGASAIASGNDVVVTVPTLADNKRITLTLSGVNGAVNPSPVSMGFLVGDTNNSRSVNSSDISAVKARSGQTTTAANFKFDVNANGSINSADISAVKARSGLTLP